MSAVVTVQRRTARRTAIVTAVLAVAVLAVFLLALSIGDFPIAVPDVVRTLFGGGTVRDDYIVLRLRLPRALAGLLVGLAFGLSGALFQRLLRNPLASPDVIGVTAGSSLAAVLCLVTFGVTGVIVPAAALAGGLLTSVVIYVLAWRRGVTGHRLVLVGIGIAALAASAMSYFLTRSDVRIATQALVWITGSFARVGWAEVRMAGVFLVVLVPAAVLLGRTLSVLQLGDDAAMALGVRVERVRLGLLALAAALCGVATSVGGPIAFVAFLSGPIATRILRTGRPGLASSALVGALITLLADFAAQHLLSGTHQLPVGVVTGAVGAPYLLYLLATANRGART
ncbi:iron chelate uptake ABC transporter family permease subunit [Amycolatopsis endophytica]|uniref:Iron complex transport system permease protein n=1 Tax=Amycolatopsis endophytica TaxID=860233 RepID=A0A853BFH3_9PSEU|nr:iron chelate uptake ABC transporter family permease subunit [Amycolatopsis endophytica]NYI93505.1 iron complex transport system permease protein [Amycolatopsis endophytica]